MNIPALGMRRVPHATSYSKNDTSAPLAGERRRFPSLNLRSAYSLR